MFFKATIVGRIFIFGAPESSTVSSSLNVVCVWYLRIVQHPY